MAFLLIHPQHACLCRKRLDVARYLPLGILSFSQRVVVHAFWGRWKVYAYRNGDKEWYVFSESLNDWAPASKTVVELKKEGASSLIEGNYHDALTSFEKALASSIDKYGQDDPRTAEAYEGIGYAQNSLGDYSGALGSHEKALSIRLKTKVIANRHNFLRTNYLTGRDCPAFHER